MGGTSIVFSCAQDVAFCLVGCCGSCSFESLFFACPGLWVLFPWVLVFDVVLVFVGPCMRAFGHCLSGVFCFWLMPLCPCFKGGAVRFSFFLGPFPLCMYSFVGLCLLVIILNYPKK